MTADWRRKRAPSLAEFEEMTLSAFAALPERFRTMCGRVVIQAADFAPDETLDALDIDDPFELSGLYEGVDLTRESISDPAALPNLVHLYRRPILDEWAERGDIALGELITHVLVHEIGHHFGLSDEEMHR
ncbi:MAG TPA: metallopeptidase family protein, partial [Parvularculaceae bacterium]|nr:metallopeptidase family protein [Parvularculaceae bacterium]